MAFVKHSATDDEIKTAEDPAQTTVKNHNIRSVKLPPHTQTTPLETVNFRAKDGLNYVEVKKQFINKEQNSNSRFTLNELSRRMMSVEEEENRRIEADVQRRMKVVFGNYHEKVKAEAHQEGYQAGLVQGKSEILQELKPAIESFDHFLKVMDHMSADMVSANEELIMRIFTKAAKKLFLKEIATDQDYIKRAISYVIEKIGTRENIKVFVSTKALEQAQIISTDVMKSFGELKNLTIEGDPTMTDGARIETDYGTIDASIETQLNHFEKVLIEGKT